MNTKKVLRYMKDRRQGFRWEEWYEPSGSVELHGDEVPCGLMQTRTVSNGGGTEEVEVWTAPILKKKGERRPPRADRGAGRSLMTNPWTNRELDSSSTLEMKCAYHLMGSRHVREVVDQYPTVPYRNAEGQDRETRFDFLATLDDGRSIAIAVKPHDSVQKRGLDDVVKRSRPGLRGVANDAIILTELELTAERLWNNKSTVRARRALRQDDLDFMLDLLPSWHGTFCAFQLAAQLPTVARGEVAVWLLIRAGVLKMVNPERRLCDASHVYVDNSILVAERSAKCSVESTEGCA
ncbi:Hypothetical protein NGAL_HAMBI2605_18250 [Neorhizobium galegae bv. orientalis]|nr:Hypothetical protein NGAL_HAMBI2605_18250 [Neorhizobium galegae bv. orientalis]